MAWIISTIDGSPESAFDFVSNTERSSVQGSFVVAMKMFRTCTGGFLWRSYEIIANPPVTPIIMKSACPLIAIIVVVFIGILVIQVFLF